MPACPACQHASMPACYPRHIATTPGTIATTPGTLLIRVIRYDQLRKASAGRDPANSFRSSHRVKASAATSGNKKRKCQHSYPRYICYLPQALFPRQGRIFLTAAYWPLGAASATQLGHPPGVQAPYSSDRPRWLPVCRSAGPGSKLPCREDLFRSPRNRSVLFDRKCGYLPEWEKHRVE